MPPRGRRGQKAEETAPEEPEALSEKELNKLKVPELKKLLERAGVVAIPKLKKDLVAAALAAQGGEARGNEAPEEEDESALKPSDHVEVSEESAPEEPAPAPSQESKKRPRVDEDGGAADQVSSSTPGSTDDAGGNEPALKRAKTESVSARAPVVAVASSAPPALPSGLTSRITATSDLQLQARVGDVTSAADEPADAALKRFRAELEFVQCLANPSYLFHIASDGYFDPTSDKGLTMAKYLRYLRYWRQPRYARFVTYPDALEVLDLLQDEGFRTMLADANFINFIRNQQIAHWAHYARNRSLEDLQSVQDQSLEAAVGAALGVSADAGGMQD
jgi:mediator of RNA polymerase II transcription subunit 31